MTGTATALASRQPRRILGIRASAIAEIAAFFLMALAADYFLLGGSRFAGVEPHPFWAIILLTATQYGAGEGLLAAALASAVLLFDMPEQGFGEDLYDWVLRNTALPVLWCLAALILGEIRAAHLSERDRLRAELAEAREHARAISEAYERLSRIKGELEARVAAQVRTVRAMYDASRAIDSKNTSGVIVGVEGLVRSVLSPAKFSLFFMGGKGLELVAADGWDPEDAYAGEFASASPLFQAVIVRRETLVAVNPEHEALLGREGIIAGPLFSEDTGMVIGMLKIDEIAFAQLNPATMQNFRIVCDWIATAYDRAHDFERAYATRFDFASVPKQSQRS